MRLPGRGRASSGDGAWNRFEQRRAEMVDRQLAARAIRDPLVLGAMADVPRERFVPDALVERAYDDGALAIGNGQTISQPYMVARMSEALVLGAWIAAHPGVVPRVLDVGTGSGYQAAVLARMGARVVSVERDPDLAVAARTRLAELDFLDVSVVVGDGSAGWPEDAPYAGILVAAAAPEPPEPLLAELDDGARLVVPVGRRDIQELVAVQRVGRRLETETLEPCVFVPLVGRYGFTE
ncbi:MAG: protein-L-isoaspartate(D-aspartate) O-methyltransferase [Candidatus Limnocylindrales bacterium]